MPTRTCVAPCCTAASRSPLIPAETQRASGWWVRKSAATSARRAKAGRGVLAEGRDRHHAAQQQPVGRGHLVGERRHVAGGGAAATALPGLPVEADLEQHPEVVPTRHRCPAERSDQTLAGPPTGPRRPTPRPLRPCCSAGARRSARSGTSESAHSSCLATASWWRFSPTWRTPSSARWRTSSAGKCLVTTTRVTSSRAATRRGARGPQPFLDLGQVGRQLVPARGHRRTPSGLIRTSPAILPERRPSRR